MLRDCKSLQGGQYDEYLYGKASSALDSRKEVVTAEEINEILHNIKLPPGSKTAKVILPQVQLVL